MAAIDAKTRLRPALATDAQILAWAGDWSSCVLLTRAHHPTLAIDAIATGLLLAACAAGVYTDGLVLAPRLLRAGRSVAYGVALAATMLGSTIAGVLAIQAAYDVMWGPDPARYSFAFNLATDGLAVALHVAAAAVLRGIFMRRDQTLPRERPG